MATQPNARLQVVIAVVVIALGLVLRLDRVEWCALVLAMTLVLAAEAFNTAVEILGDAVSEGRHHALVGRSKDVAAGAVLLAAMGAAVVGGIIFLPHLLRLAGW